MLFILEEVKKAILDFLQGTVRVLTLCNSLIVKLPNSQLNNFKSGIKNGTEVTLNLSSNLIADSNDKTNFKHKLLLTDEEGFVKLLQLIYQLIQNYRKLNCLTIRRISK